MTEVIKQWIYQRSRDYANDKFQSGHVTAVAKTTEHYESGLSKGIEIAEGFEKFKIKEGYQLYPNGWYSNEPAAAGKQTWFTFDELLEKYIETINRKK